MQPHDLHGAVGPHGAGLGKPRRPALRDPKERRRGGLAQDRALAGPASTTRFLKRQARKAPLKRALLALQSHAIAQVFEPSGPIIGRIFRGQPGAAAVHQHTGPDTLKKDDSPHIHRGREMGRAHESQVTAATGMQAKRRGEKKSEAVKNNTHFINLLIYFNEKNIFELVRVIILIKFT
jgi:hypothetical protein